MMKTEVTSRELAKLLGLTSSRITDLRKRKIIIPAISEAPIYCKKVSAIMSSISEACRQSRRVRPPSNNPLSGKSR